MHILRRGYWMNSSLIYFKNVSQLDRCIFTLACSWLEWTKGVLNASQDRCRGDRWWWAHHLRPPASSELNLLIDSYTGLAFVNLNQCSWKWPQTNSSLKWDINLSVPMAFSATQTLRLFPDPFFHHVSFLANTSYTEKRNIGQKETLGVLPPFFFFF